MMKRWTLTLAMLASLTAVQAQNRTKQDTAHMIVNPDHLKTDSVKRGQEVYLPGKNQPDTTTSQRQKPKKQPATRKEATKPNQR